MSNRANNTPSSSMQIVVYDPTFAMQQMIKWASQFGLRMTSLPPTRKPKPQTFTVRKDTTSRELRLRRQIERENLNVVTVQGKNEGSQNHSSRKPEAVSGEVIFDTPHQRAARRIEQYNAEALEYAIAAVDKLRAYRQPQPEMRQ